MRKLGCKLWTNNWFKNNAFFREVAGKAREKEFDYVELFVFPGSCKDTLQPVCEELKGLPVIIHNSHSSFGFDTGNAEREKANLQDVNDAKHFADKLNAPIIIVHAGCGDKEENRQETIRQFRLFADNRIAVENLPYTCGIGGDLQAVNHGNSVADVKLIKEMTGCKFCLDFSHAICAANHAQINYNDFLQDMVNLRPDMFHLCDGHMDKTDDEHLHFGEGNYPLAHLLNDYVYDQAFVTMETGHETPVTSKPWLDDKIYLRKIEKI